MSPDNAAHLRPAWVEIDLDAVRANTALARRLVGGTKLYAVCKGDGYGGGAIEIGQAALEGGADALAVGNPAEALALRRHGLRCPILLYACSLPEDASRIATLNVTATIHDFSSLAAFAALGRDVEAFVKVDCGLGRLGFNPDEFSAAFARLAAAPLIRMAGIYAHLAVPEDEQAVAQQMRCFAAACGAAEAAGFSGFERMVASSRVLIGFPGLKLTAINPGRFILGMVESPWDERVKLQPAVRAVKARIIQIKNQPAGTLGYGGPGSHQSTDRPCPVRAAVLPIGFGEGFPHLPPCHEVLVQGQRAPVLSRRGIEHTVIDVTNIRDVHIGSEAVLLGRQNGAEISAAELSQALRVPLLELLPRLARCAPRRYVTSRASVNRSDID